MVYYQGFIIYSILYKSYLIVWYSVKDMCYLEPRNFVDINKSKLCTLLILSETLHVVLMDSSVHTDLVIFNTSA